MLMARALYKIFFNLTFYIILIYLAYSTMIYSYNFFFLRSNLAKILFLFDFYLWLKNKFNKKIFGQQEKLKVTNLSYGSPNIWI